jgi:hypothetical protein
MAERLFAAAGEPKELWLVPKAKHNQAHCVARDEYQRRITAFFDQHLTAAPLTAPELSRESLVSADKPAAATTVAASG